MDAAHSVEAISEAYLRCRGNAREGCATEQGKRAYRRSRGPKDGIAAGASNGFVEKDERGLARRRETEMPVLLRVTRRKKTLRGEQSMAASVRGKGGGCQGRKWVARGHVAVSSSAACLRELIKNKYLGSFI